MKRLLQFIMLFFAIAFVQACEGPEGDVGPQGEQGPQGATGAQGPAGTSAPTPVVYNISGWDFTAEDNWQLGINFDSLDIEVNETDAILVYRLLSAFEGENEEVVPVWEPLPATYIRTEGIFQYGFLNTPYELGIYMQGQFDLATLEEEYINDQLFRILVIPAEYKLRTDGTKIKVDLSKYPVNFKNYDEVIKYFKIKEEDVKEINIKN